LFGLFMPANGFLSLAYAFVEVIAPTGAVNGLVQTALKMTVAGMPDFFQGTEFWDFSLVDPDNRRPVDYGLRRRLLADLKTGLGPEAILARMDEGLPKLWVLHRALELRRRLPAAFGPEGRYEPLAAQGERAAHAVAFRRGGEVVMVAPRLVLGLKDGWGNTALDLPAGSWRNELTGETLEGGEVRLASLLARFPVALLARTG
jgi:(1->4)-alpha-D-glucan 1-alpha-D-glucosylmutase